MEFKYNDPVVVSVSGDKRHKRRRSRLLPLILSILFAFALWFYVMSVESPIYEKTFNFVPVTVIQNNSEGALSVYSGGETAYYGDVLICELLGKFPGGSETVAGASA